MVQYFVSLHPHYRVPNNGPMLFWDFYDPDCHEVPSSQLLESTALLPTRSPVPS